MADKDYPIYAEVPVTSFTCKGRHEGGYYADVETRCQVSVFLVPTERAW